MFSMSLWLSCLYCSLVSAQLCCRSLSWCWPKIEGVLQKCSNLIVKEYLYLEVCDICGFGNSLRNVVVGV